MPFNSSHSHCCSLLFSLRLSSLNTLDFPLVSNPSSCSSLIPCMSHQNRFFLQKTQKKIWIWSSETLELNLSFWSFRLFVFNCIVVCLKFCRPKQVLTMSDKGGKGGSLLSKGGNFWTFFALHQKFKFFSLFSVLGKKKLLGLIFFVRLLCWVSSFSLLMMLGNSGFV